MSQQQEFPEIKPKWADHEDKPPAQILYPADPKEKAEVQKRELREFWRKSPKTVLITGAAGSVGAALVKAYSRRPQKAVKHIIRAFDNDEYGLFRLQMECDSKRVIPILGDVKDPEQVAFAMDGVDVVLHCAAIKRIEIAEHNPVESIKTNVLGTMNLINQAHTTIHQHMNDLRFLLISSDKAVPSGNTMSLYGSTKFQQERLVLWAQRALGFQYLKFAVARFGNVIDSRGNVFEIWRTQEKQKKPLSVTDPNAKRFFWWMQDCTRFVLLCLDHMEGGEIFVPNMQKKKIMEYVNKEDSYEVVGLRPGETISQRLMTPREEAAAKNDYWAYIIKEE